MTHRVVFRPQPEREAGEARRWYEKQKPGLGTRFVEAVDAAVQRIAANPSAVPVVHDEIRRAVVRQFPYGVYFRIEPGEVIVIAVMHGRRHPWRWQSRP